MLPYWVILLIDTAIVFASCIFTWWVMNWSHLTLEGFKAALLTTLLFSALSWVGARIFRTYSGVLRYSSFVDLLKLVYANA
ncbi:MAG: polysaccharide biosynthesis protein, partial [Bacteroidota bacterium]|nr:polysaccharide biosynthesis protein [Bacteroidota bacterium]